MIAIAAKALRKTGFIPGQGVTLRVLKLEVLSAVFEPLQSTRPM